MDLKHGIMTKEKLATQRHFAAVSRSLRGDLVKAGNTITEVETDKAVLEIDSPETGTLIRIDIKVGEVVQMGARTGGLKK